jgi:replicative DNA helicase
MTVTIYQNGDEPRLPARVGTIPANLEAERAVLGSLLLDPDAIHRVTLKAEAFYRERHGWIYQAMRDLTSRHEPIDFVTLSAELSNQHKLEEVGGPAYLTDLVTNLPTAMYVEHYVKLVEHAYFRRQIITICGKAAELAYNEGVPIEEVTERCEQLWFNLSAYAVNHTLKPIAKIMEQVIERLSYLWNNKGVVMGVPTGFTYLDQLLGGFQKSDLIILAGRPGMGKSAWVLSVAKNAAKQFGARIAVFSLEMSNEQMVERLLAMESGIDSHRLRLGDLAEEEWPTIMQAANDLTQTHIYIDDTPAASVSDIRSKARRLWAEEGLDMIVIDYMQLMSGSGGADMRQENRQQEISYISRSLKALARELNVPVIALSQLSRAVEQRADKRPMLSDLRESGSLEQDADVVLFIYREDYYDKEADSQNIADVLVAKHRHGSTGTVKLFFRKELTQFRDLEIQRHELDYDHPDVPAVLNY